LSHKKIIMRNIFRISIVFIVFHFISCNQNKSGSDFKIVYKNDKEGNTLIGSKQELIKYIRAGASIKIGWGVKGKERSIEHLSEPIWIAVMNESEVGVQLAPHISSAFTDTSKINEEWRVKLNTKGEFNAVWYDKYDGTLIKRVPQNHTMTWFAKGNIENSKPLFLNE